MLHKSRIWKVSSVASIQKLADKLFNQTWTSCTAFEWEGLIFANDQTSPDGAGEWAVIDKENQEQIESVTYGWMDNKKEVLVSLMGMYVYVNKAYSVHLDKEKQTPPMNVPIDIENFETPDEHGRCSHCA